MFWVYVLIIFLDTLFLDLLQAFLLKLISIFQGFRVMLAFSLLVAKVFSGILVRLIKALTKRAQMVHRERTVAQQTEQRFWIVPMVP